MVRPADFPTFATNANYTTGPHSGTPTKIAMTSGDTQNGNISGIAPNARKYNWWQNLVGLWVTQLASELDVLNAATSTQPFVIWRPSEPSPAGNVYASFTSAATAALALPYRIVEVWIDTSLASTVVLPTSTVNLNNRVRLVSHGNVTLQFDANSVLQNPAGFRAEVVPGTSSAAMTLQVTNATGGAAIQSSTIASLRFENVRFDPGVHGRTMVTGLSSNQHFEFVNCRLSGTYTFTSTTRVSLSGPRMVINGNTVMTSATALLLHTDNDEATWAPGFSNDRGGNVFPTIVMLQAFIAGHSNLKGSSCRGRVVFDGSSSSGTITMTQNLDLYDIFDLSVVGTTTLAMGAFFFIAPYRNVDFGMADVTTSTDRIIDTNAAATVRRSLTLSSKSKTFSRSSGSGLFSLVYQSHNTYSELVYNNILRNSADARYFRITTAMAGAGTTLRVEFNGSFDLQSGAFWSRQSAGNDVDTTVYYNSSYPLLAESYHAAWDLTGTLVIYDQWQRRLPKSFPVQSTSAANVDWNFRRLWQDMPDGIYSADINLVDNAGGFQLYSFRFQFTVAARVVTGIGHASLALGMYYPVGGSVSGTSFVVISSGNLRFVNSLFNTYGATGVQLIVIGSDVGNA